jgi:hypothetical protein
LRLKSWYGASRLRRMRKWIGEPVHVSDVIERPSQQSELGDRGLIR